MIRAVVSVMLVSVIIPPAIVWADTIFLVHFAWAVWMVVGIALSFAGFFYPRVWDWRAFRIAHLVGILFTASTPLWGEGFCPLTEWEWQLRQALGTAQDQPRSFILRLLHDLLYWDVDPLVLSLVTGAAALATVVIFILRPPWGRRFPYRSRTVQCR
jgi:hypothetical protein